MTYDEIEAAASRLVAAGGRSLPEHARPMLIAYMQHTSGLAVTARCPFCGLLLSVVPLSSSAWSVSCPCGRSHDTLRGL